MRSSPCLDPYPGSFHGAYLAPISPQHNLLPVSQSRPHRNRPWLHVPHTQVRRAVRGLRRAARPARGRRARRRGGATRLRRRLPLAVRARTVARRRSRRLAGGVCPGQCYRFIEALSGRPSGPMASRPIKYTPPHSAAQAQDIAAARAFQEQLRALGPAPEPRAPDPSEHSEHDDPGGAERATPAADAARARLEGVLARATERYTLLAQRADVDGAAGCLRVAGRALRGRGEAPSLQGGAVVGAR